MPQVLRLLTQICFNSCITKYRNTPVCYLNVNYAEVTHTCVHNKYNIKGIVKFIFLFENLNFIYVKLIFNFGNYISYVRNSFVRNRLENGINTSCYLQAITVICSN